MALIGQVPIAPAVNAPIPVGAISVASLGALTGDQQTSIERGTVVVTPTQSYVYTGSGSKTNAASYVALIPSGVERTSNKNIPTGYAGLSSVGKIAVSQIPDALANPDPDVTAYCSSCGITSLDTKAKLQDFVLVMKDLGLFDNMACWPLRLGQNAVAGSTRYSLGGLGNYNGTLFSATQVANGVAFNGTNSYMTAPISSANGNVSRAIISVTSNWQANPNVPSPALVGPGWGSLASTRFAARRESLTSACLDKNDSGQMNHHQFALTNGLTDPVYICASYKSSNQEVLVYINGTLVSQSSVPMNIAAQTVMRLNGWGTSPGHGVGIFAFAAVFDTHINNASDLGVIYNAYKTTLGAGLEGANGAFLP